MTKWALVSVFDKAGLIPFCQQLLEAGYGILSTGGTAKHLTDNGLPVTKVEDYTGFPEMLDGRVKTLHPKIHGGLLGIRDDEEHTKKMAEHGIDVIDVVVVNLYPFEATVKKPESTFEDCVEMIDIGGPSMLRAAAKNHRYVAVVVNPLDYGWVGEKLRSQTLDERDRQKLATKVFQTTAAYDALIAEYLVEQTTDSEERAQWPQTLQVNYVSKQSLRYGENPHQKAHFYAEANAAKSTIAGALQLQGKELSYNNIQDADAALQIVRAFDDLHTPVAVAVKHTNPCGVGLGETTMDAYNHAYEADPVSIFGGIVAFNRAVDGSVAAKLTELFLEIVIAPSFTDEAKELFQKKKNVRLLEVNMDEPLWQPAATTMRRVSGGLLVQDVNQAGAGEWNVVTERKPSADEIRALEFAWRVVKFVKSNAIVLANAERTLGVGAGQMNRVGAAKIAIEQAGAKAAGSVLASDAFFPMRDTLDMAAKAGIAAIIQPGGSIRDQESIDAANEYGVAMVFTGQRHFMH